ncbi:hypothetical protein TruAng_009923 [Truncatella angustata]|nr:hypothetical protein TruAng_009923 [Truncatella angustata]
MNWFTNLCLVLITFGVSHILAADREGPYWLHVTSQANTSINGYAYHDDSNGMGTFNYNVASAGHDVRIDVRSHFMLNRQANQSNSTAQPQVFALSYSQPGLATPEPQDPNPGAAYLEFEHSLGTPLARALFAHYGDDGAWPIQPMDIEPVTKQLGFYRREGPSNPRAVEQGRGGFLSFWCICWGRWYDEEDTISSSLFWSLVTPEDEDCTPADLALEKVVK